MQDLKKYAAIGGALVLVASWPLAVGHIGQKVATDGINYINNESVITELIEYDRSYFSSTAQTRIEIQDPIAREQLIADGLPTTILLNHEISHGIASISTVTTLADSSQLPITLSSKTQLNGNTEFSIDIGELLFNVDDSEAGIRIAPAISTGNISVSGDLNYQASFPLIEVSFESGETANVAQLNFSSVGKLQNQMLLGTQSLSIETLDFTDMHGGAIVAVAGAEYSIETSELDNRIAGAYKMAVDEFNVGLEQAKNVQLQFGAGGFDKESLLGLIDIMQTSQELTDQQVEAVFPLLEQLLMKGFYFNLAQFDLEVGEGKFQSSWNLALAEGNSGLSQDMLSLLNHLDGNLNTFITSEMIEMYPFIRQNLDELIIMEFVQEESEGFLIDVKLANGQVEFSNGQKVPLMTVLMPLLM
jgi:uncharacterized protein YdgA (DUF945 family)